MCEQPLHRHEEVPWDTLLADQIVTHGWEPIMDYPQLELRDTGNVDCEPLIEFRYPKSTAVLELTNISEDGKSGVNLTLTHPFDPSFGSRDPKRTREPFVWALSEAHQAIADEHVIDRAATFTSPDVVLSIDMPESSSRNEAKEAILGITLTAIGIRQLHSELYHAVDYRRPDHDESTVDAVMNGFERT